MDGKVFNQEGEITQEHQGKDSALAALKNLLNKHFKFEIINHKSESDREGIEAESISTIIISVDQKYNFEGIGQDSDIEISALKALINAVNKGYVFLNFKNKQ